MVTPVQSQGKKVRGVKKKVQTARDATAVHDKPDQLLSEAWARARSYAVHLYDPDQAGSSPSPVPSVEPIRTTARSVPKIINYTSATDGEVCVWKLYPRLDSCISASLGGAVPAASSSLSIAVKWEGTVPASTTIYGGTSEQPPHFWLLSNGAIVQELTPLWDSVASTWYVAAGFTDGSLTTTILNRGSYSYKATPRYYSGGAWTSPGSYYTVASGGGSITVTATTATTTRITFHLQNGYTVAAPMKIECVFNATPGVTITPPATDYHKMYTLVDDPGNVDELRFTAFGALLSCFGDATHQGGAVAAALVPMEWEPDPVDPYGSVASLPDMSYNGRLVDGAHVGWLPIEKSDFTLRPVEEWAPSHYIVIVTRAATSGIELRLDIRANYEFYSIDPTQGTMRWNPSAGNMMDLLRYVYATVSPASSNSGHLKKVRQVIGAVKGLGTKALKMGRDWVLANPDVLLNAAKAGAAMLL